MLRFCLMESAGMLRIIITTYEPVMNTMEVLIYQSVFYISCILSLLNIVEKKNSS